MTKDSSQKSWGHAILRAAVVSGTGILVGFALYQSLIFVPTAKASQFFMSGITAGLAYGSFKSSNVRNGLAALLVWLIVLLLLANDFQFWLLTMGLAYIGGITIAVYLYDYIVKRQIVRTPILRILLAGGFIAIANGLIVIVLGLFSFREVVAHLRTFTEQIYQNIQLGALLGLATGVGIEIAEYLVRQLPDVRSSMQNDNPEEQQILP